MSDGPAVSESRHNAASAGARASFWLKRLWPLALVALAFVLVFAFDLHRYISFETLRQHRVELLAFVDRYPVLAPLLYVAIYTVVVALSIPGAAAMTVAAGFLFGVWLGTVCVVIGATLGATAVFLVARTALGNTLRAKLQAKGGPRLRRMEEGFRENAFNYLLFVRLIPVFPFWLVNLVPAFLGVPLLTYVLATLIGIIPGSLVYASVGNGLGAVFDAGETPDLGIIFRPDIILPIVGLALLALLPIGYRKFKARAAR
jgi:uncharacterized membrane protein YdjX (TVP38/TMEM64 family)